MSTLTFQSRRYSCWSLLAAQSTTSSWPPYFLMQGRNINLWLVVAWLDLANVYGSMHHSLMVFTLHHYHASSHFCNIVASLYSELLASITTITWTTPSSLLSIGVYQGDPLSEIICNTVTNSLIATLKIQAPLPPSHPGNLLQYADDTCIIANSPAPGQALWASTDRWLQWEDMKAKVPKCHAMCLKSSSGELVDPHLTISD